MTTMTSKEFIRLAKKNGWSEVKHKGSHLRLRKSGKPDLIVPVHNRSIATGLLNKLLKQAELE